MLSDVGDVFRDFLGDSGIRAEMASPRGCIRGTCDRGKPDHDCARRFALGLGLLLVGLRDRSRGVWNVVDRYGGPAVTIAFLIIIIPILPATKDNFYYGATTLKDSVRSIAEGFIKTERHWPGSNPDPFLDAVGYVLVPILLAALLLLVIVSARKYIRSQPAAYRLSTMVILGTTAVASALRLDCSPFGSRGEVPARQNRNLLLAGLDCRGILCSASRRRQRDSQH